MSFLGTVRGVLSSLSLGIFAGSHGVLKESPVLGTRQILSHVALGMEQLSGRDLSDV